MEALKLIPKKSSEKFCVLKGATNSEDRHLSQRFNKSSNDATLLHSALTQSPVSYQKGGSFGLVSHALW